MHVEGAVENGIGVLNEYHGGEEWVREIDLDTLDQYSIETCVVSQQFGCYSDGVNELLGDEHVIEDEYDHGFDRDGGRDDFADLTDRWRERILDIRWRLAMSQEVEKHPVSAQVELMLTERQIGRLYLGSKRQGLTIEQVLGIIVEEWSDEITDSI